MTWVAHGVALALTWFLLVNVALSAAAAAAAGFVLRWLGRRESPGAGAGLLAVRLLPFLVSTAFVVLAFAPSYVLLEPRSTGEKIDAPLVVVSTIAALLVAVSLWRGFSTWRETSRAAARLAATGTSLGQLAGADAYAIAADQPALLLVGAWRPRLLVTRGLLDLLSPTELDAALRHEAAHRSACDNLKRFAIRAVPDFWSWTPGARAIGRAWAAAAESSADRSAVASRAEAVALASAIVKVARRTITPPMLPCASLLVDGPDVAMRVHALLAERSVTRAKRRIPRTGLLLVGAAAVLAWPHAIALVHEASEILVRTL